MKTLLLVAFLLVMTSLAMAEQLPCEKEYIDADNVRFAMTDPALSAEKMSEYKTQLEILQPKLDACFAEYTRDNGEEAYQELVYHLGG